MTAPLPETLPDADWRNREGLAELCDALGAGAGEARYVGGAVRDGLLGLPVKDVDIATVHLPEDVAARIKAAGFKAVPTGIAHGTVTAVIHHWPVEITTLRRDVSTDGRRATVAFGTDWRADAARRDFTINALYADPSDGALLDFFDGRADLAARRVRFIGDPDARIAEDHLRILRYFRFAARFGTVERASPDYAACVTHAQSLKSLSRERIADELLKLLALPDPSDTLAAMAEDGILAPVLPEIGAPGVAALRALVAAERASATPPEALRRLLALLPPDATLADNVGARLRLSNKARARMAAVLAPPEAATPEGLAYRIGVPPPSTASCSATPSRPPMPPCSRNGTRRSSRSRAAISSRWGWCRGRRSRARSRRSSGSGSRRVFREKGRRAPWRLRSSCRCCAPASNHRHRRS